MQAHETKQVIMQTSLKTNKTPLKHICNPEKEMDIPQCRANTPNKVKTWKETMTTNASFVLQNNCLEGTRHWFSFVTTLPCLCPCKHDKWH